jgi:hypothetical protein
MSRRLPRVMELKNSTGVLPSTPLILQQSTHEASGIPGRTIAALKEDSAGSYKPDGSCQNLGSQDHSRETRKEPSVFIAASGSRVLEAHDDLVQAKCPSHSDDGCTSTDNGISECEETIERTEKTRQEMGAAWVAARHVQGVRVVNPIPPPFPVIEIFEEEDDCGFPKFQCGRWIAYMSAAND